MQMCDVAYQPDLKEILDEDDGKEYDHEHGWFRPETVARLRAAVRDYLIHFYSLVCTDAAAAKIREIAASEVKEYVDADRRLHAVAYSESIKKMQRQTMLEEKRLRAQAKGKGSATGKSKTDRGSPSSGPADEEEAGANAAPSSTSFANVSRYLGETEVSGLDQDELFEFLAEQTHPSRVGDGGSASRSLSSGHGLSSSNSMTLAGVSDSFHLLSKPADDSEESHQSDDDDDYAEEEGGDESADAQDHIFGLGDELADFTGADQHQDHSSGARQDID
jgi:hypothetical protein